MSEPLPSTNRRGFFGWMGRIGLTTIGAVAGLSATQQPVFGAGSHRAACCSLAKPPGGCHGSGSGFLCPGVGLYKKTWNCCHTDGKTYGCGECQNTQGSCWDGDDYACSEYWLVRNGC